MPAFRVTMKSPGFSSTLNKGHHQSDWFQNSLLLQVISLIALWEWNTGVRPAQLAMEALPTGDREVRRGSQPLFACVVLIRVNDFPSITWHSWNMPVSPVREGRICLPACLWACRACWADWLLPWLLQSSILLEKQQKVTSFVLYTEHCCAVCAPSRPRITQRASFLSYWPDRILHMDGNHSYSQSSFP
jgi:hypothetical protein